MRKLTFILLPVLGLALQAEAISPELKVRSSTFSIVTENDKFFAGTDQHYTNGLKLSWLGETNLNESHNFVQTVAKFVPWLDPEQVDWRYKVGFALGQNIYTPSDITTTELLPDDRPYAGWLYGSIILQAQVENQLRIIELSLGVVGPSALGEQAQNGFHDLLNIAHAQGWAHQLEEEPGVRLSWERRYRGWHWHDPAHPALGVDLVLRHRLTLGNISTHLAGGAVVRIGWHLPTDFGPDLIRPGGGNTPISGGPRRFGAYVFGSAEARVVERNIFLDGNTWVDSHSVDKRPIVADLSLGLVLQWPSFRFAYTQDYRTKEFYGQSRRDVFGSIGFSLTR